MKTYKLITLGIAMLIIAACKKNDEEVASGNPKIDRIRLTNPAKKDSTFTAALPGTQIVIEGENIGGVQKIYFNDTEAWFNPVYNTDRHMIVTIPKYAPTAANQPEVKSKIRMVTTHGEVSYDFTLTPPDPIITSINNENTIPGQEMTILGESLFQVQSITFPGNRVVTEFSVSAAGNQILVKVPADLRIESGILTVTTKFGSANSAGVINKVAGEGMISNFSQASQIAWGVFNWGYFGGIVTNNASLFPNNREHYLQNIFGGIDANNSNWYEGNRSGNFTRFKVFNTFTAGDPAASYALKFEMNTIEPWKAGVCLLRFNDAYAHRWMPYLTAANKSFSTGNTWQTITVPLSEFKTSEGKGNAAVTLGNIVAADGTLLLNYRFITETEPIALFNSAFDNFRIVKIK
ncbi:MAG: glycan-binding surface protein [Bacteroidota bacterium]